MTWRDDLAHAARVGSAARRRSRTVYTAVVLAEGRRSCAACHREPPDDTRQGLAAAHTRSMLLLQRHAGECACAMREWPSTFTGA